jgi:hypothetical protein
MAEKEHASPPAASVDEIQQGWAGLTLKLAQLEAEQAALERENEDLRKLLERVIEHRQKSHGELVLLLTTLVGKLPLNDVGGLVSRLVEHNTNVSQALAALLKGTADVILPQPAVLQTLEETKRNLATALKPLVEELLRLETPLETDLLQAVLTKPEAFFSPRMVRANRCFVKGQVPRERVVREFGEEGLVFFNDMTTDPKLNPRPKQEEIALAFKNDFETLLAQSPNLAANKRQELTGLHQRIQQSKGASDRARAQRLAFQKLTFLIELLHYYEHQNTEAPDVLFAQRLPALVEQLVLTGPQDNLDEKLIVQAESLLAYVISPEHRQMIINNIGKGGGAAKTLKYVLRLRAGNVSELHHVLAEFVRHLIPQKAPPVETLTAVLRLVNPDMQRLVTKAIICYDRIRKEEAEALGKAVGAALGLKGLAEEIKAQEVLSPEVERQLAWNKIKDLIARRSDATAIAAAIRDRLNAKYDAEEIRQSWLTLIDADAMSFIRIFCQVPYRSDGRTDSIARTVLETYVSRLTHEKYAATYRKVVNSLRTMHAAKPDSPSLVNFMALVRWVDAAAADKLAADIGMAVPAH